jgi:hemoglobin-like flavoprotein
MVRQSCVGVADQPVLLAESFYRHLFELAPAVRGMFPADMSVQNGRMSQALLAVVRGADDPARMEAFMQQMGARHAHYYGAAAEHYPYVGRALVRAVRELSPRWSTAVGSAWVQVYEWMAAHMLLGAAHGGSVNVSMNDAASA